MRFLAWLVLVLAAGVLGGCGSLHAVLAEAKYPRTGEFVTTSSGYVMHYLRRGQGHPVIMVHGAIGTAIGVNSTPAFEKLSREFDAIAPDRPGYGYSPRAPYETLTPADHARILHEFILALKLKERPVLIGHSWGGAVMLAYAVAYPGEARAIVLLAPAAYPLGKPEQQLYVVPATPIIGDVYIETLAPLMAAIFAPGLEQTAFSPYGIVPEYRDLTRALLLRPCQMRAAARDGLTLDATLAALWPHYPQISDRLIILCGDDDHLVSCAGNSARLHKAVPGSELRMLAGGSHMIPYQFPEQVLAAVRDAFGEPPKP